MKKNIWLLGSVCLVALLTGCAARQRDKSWDAHNTYLKVVEKQLSPTVQDFCAAPKNWLEQYECAVRTADPGNDKDQNKIRPAPQ